jgi:hypothetical protein
MLYAVLRCDIPVTFAGPKVDGTTIERGRKSFKWTWRGNAGAGIEVK